MHRTQCMLRTFETFRSRRAALLWLARWSRVFLTIRNIGATPPWHVLRPVNSNRVED